MVKKNRDEKTNISFSSVCDKYDLACHRTADLQSYFFEGSGISEILFDSFTRILCFNFYFKINKRKNIRSHILFHDFYFHFGNYKTGKRNISRKTGRFFNNDFSCRIDCDTVY